MVERLVTNVDSEISIGCGCSACRDGHTDNLNYNNNELNFYGGSLGNFWNVLDNENAPTDEADPGAFADYLVNGYWEDRGQHTGSWQQDNITFSFNGFNEAQKSGFRMAFELWDDVADITFTEVSQGADIRVIEHDNATYAMTGSNVEGTGTDNVGEYFTIAGIFIGTNQNQHSNIDEIGSSDFLVALHEIGHALGLGHTANYNGGLWASYHNTAQWVDDTQQMTVMSYHSEMNVRSDHWDSTGEWQKSATPMLIDVLAIQSVYGADYTTRNSDTIYGFNSNAGRDQFDFTISEAPVTIWDGGGNDTLDLSGYSTNQTISLEEGEFSSVGHMTNNLVISYGAEIENAIGGSGKDLIYSNDLNNNIEGNLGNDIFFGSLGDDNISGGAGSDTLIYKYSMSDFVYSFINNNTVSLRHITKNFTDLITDVEKFVFHEGSYNFSDLNSFNNAMHKTELSFIWNTGEFTRTLSDDGTVIISANDIGYSGAIGDQFQIIKTNFTTNIKVLNDSAPNTIRFLGTDSSDTITIDGTHTNFTGNIVAGNLNDKITMLINSDDYLEGGNGDDIIYAGDGVDKVFGNHGRDILYGEAGNDRLFGGSGQDNLNGGVGNDVLYGEKGNDELNGNNGDDKLHGGDGDDLIFGGAGRDRIIGGFGADRLSGGDGDDIVIGNAGNDDIEGGVGNDRLYAGSGDDVVTGGSGADVLYGGEGSDVLLGEEGNDVTFGGDGHDYLFGEDGDDVLKGQGGDDLLDGGDGDDYLFGGVGNDELESGAGNDWLWGDSGDDVLYAYEGTNMAYGGDGNDVIMIWDGKHTLTGGSGNDVFDLNIIDGEVDKIKDFTLTGGDFDILNITDLLTNYISGTSDINDFVELYYISSERTDLFVNSDGQDNDFVNVAEISGSSFSGVNLENLLASGHLIVDTTL